MRAISFRFCGSTPPGRVCVPQDRRCGLTNLCASPDGLVSGGPVKERLRARTSTQQSECYPPLCPRAREGLDEGAPSRPGLVLAAIVHRLARETPVLGVVVGASVETYWPIAAGPVRR